MGSSVTTLTTRCSKASGNTRTYPNLNSSTNPLEHHMKRKPWQATYSKHSRPMVQKGCYRCTRSEDRHDCFLEEMALALQWTSVIRPKVLQAKGIEAIKKLLSVI